MTVLLLRVSGGARAGDWELLAGLCCCGGPLPVPRSVTMVTLSLKLAGELLAVSLPESC